MRRAQWNLVAISAEAEVTAEEVAATAEAVAATEEVEAAVAGKPLRGFLRQRSDDVHVNVHSLLACRSNQACFSVDDGATAPTNLSRPSAASDNPEIHFSQNAPFGAFLHFNIHTSNA